MSLNWDAVVAIAAALPGTEITTYYGDPAVKANGRPIVTPGREPGSFALHIDLDTKAMLIETDPATFWETPHYHGWPSVLVRYATDDPERVAALIARSHAWALARKPPRKR